MNKFMQKVIIENKQQQNNKLTLNYIKTLSRALVHLYITNV